MLLPSHHCATVRFVWGMEAQPIRDLLSGRPVSASLDQTQSLLNETSQLLIVELCEFLERAPPWRVRPGSMECPMLELKRARVAVGASWPVPEAEALSALATLATARSSVNQLVGVTRDAQSGAVRVSWLAVSVKSNVLAEGAPLALLDAAEWFEGVSHGHNAAAESMGSSLRGWQSSQAWIWMEALDEAVGGTAGCLASGALLTAATLLLFTGSLTLALTTVAGVVVVLTCFLGYLAERGYSLGVIEAIATTIFIGLACDYCVHVLQVHRSGTGELTHTLAHAGPSLFSSALTTAGAAAPLLFCRIAPFRTLGEFIVACTVLSLAVALTLIAPLISLSGKGGRCVCCKGDATPPPAKDVMLTTIGAGGVRLSVEDSRASVGGGGGRLSLSDDERPSVSWVSLAETDQTQSRASTSAPLDEASRGRRLSANI